MSHSPNVLVWSLAFLAFFFGLQTFVSHLGGFSQVFSIHREHLTLKEVSQAFLEFEETLEAGLIPTQKNWERLRTLSPPWGTLSHESIQDLRSRGAALLPTLKRLRALAQHHSESLSEARAKSAQSLGQAMTCGLLVPIFGGILFVLLPGMSEHPYFWLATCGIALILSGSGALWILSMALKARWGGLSSSQRCWGLSTQCAGERFLALVRSGHPPDIAWTRSCEILATDAPELALAWGYSVFENSKSSGDTLLSSLTTESTADVLIQAGHSIRKSIHMSLMEGRPCIERVEAALIALRQEMKARVDRELSLLGTRTLKPLFILVAPAMLGLLGIGMWVTWNSFNPKF